MLQEENDIILDKVSWFTFLNEKDKWKKKKKFCDLCNFVDHNCWCNLQLRRTEEQREESEARVRLLEKQVSHQ